MRGRPLGWRRCKARLEPPSASPVRPGPSTCPTGGTDVRGPNDLSAFAIIMRYLQRFSGSSGLAWIMTFGPQDDKSRLDRQHKKPVLQALYEAGATGLEPATSGVTDRISACLLDIKA